MKSIFVSSTFKDMQEERDLLNTYILPEINYYAKRYSEDIYFTDLRWGVNTENLDSDEGSRKVLDVCFDEIMKSHPFMIIFIGERYGWIPDNSILEETTNKYHMDSFNKSVTELEIEYGALSQENLDNCVFCFRTDLDTNNLSEDLKNIYEVESELHKEKIEYLKKKILERNPKNVIYYHGKFKDNELVLDSELKEQLISILKRLLDDDAENNKDLPWQEKEYRNALNNINKLNYQYCEISNIVEEVQDKIKGDAKLLIIEGENGSGKTSIMAKLYQVLSQDPNYLVYPFFGGLTERSLTKKDLYERISYFLYPESQYIVTENEEEAREGYLKNVMKIEESTNKKLIVLLDGFDEMIFNMNSPIYKLNDTLTNTKYIISLNKDCTELPNEPYEKIDVTELEDTTRKEIIHHILKYNNKELSQEVVDKILTKKCSNNPMYLKMVLQRLIKMSKKDFQKIKALGDDMQAITQTQKNIIESIPDKLEEACIYYINYAISLISKEEELLNVLKLCFVLNSKLTRADLKQLLKLNGKKLNDIELACLIKYLDIFVEEMNDGKIKITHINTLNKILDSKDNKELNKMILNYLKTLDNTNQLKRDKYVKCAMRSGEYRAILDYLTILYNSKDNDGITEQLIIFLHIISDTKDENLISDLINTIDAEKDYYLLKDIFIDKLLELFLDENDGLFYFMTKYLLNQLIKKIQILKGKNEENYNCLVEKLFYYEAQNEHQYGNYTKAKESIQESLAYNKNNLLQKIKTMFLYIKLPELYGTNEISKLVVELLTDVDILIEEENEENMLIAINVYSYVGTRFQDMSSAVKIVPLYDKMENKSITLQAMNKLANILIEIKDMEFAKKITYLVIRDSQDKKYEHKNAEILVEAMYNFIKMTKEIDNDIEEAMSDKNNLLDYMEFCKNILVNKEDFFDVYKDKVNYLLFENETKEEQEKIIEQLDNDLTEKSFEVHSEKLNLLVKMLLSIEDYVRASRYLEIQKVLLEMNNFDGEKNIEIILNNSNLRKCYIKLGEYNKGLEIYKNLFYFIKDNMKIDTIFTLDLIYNTLMLFMKYFKGEEINYEVKKYLMEVLMNLKSESGFKDDEMFLRDIDEKIKEIFKLVL